MDRDPSISGPPRLMAVLGPTNTGKTHLAMERMMAHDSGVIGFPLRLLARENYDRAVKAKGAGRVALITGEERIAPPGARYFCCTVESMPLDRPVSFVAVDEIQLAADPDRGHIFTDRLLHARGTGETMVMGAETMRPLIRRLCPGTEFTTRPRFSGLTFTGPRKLARLPRRSAVVAFSANDVYALAELVRRQRGGAAVVLGALSPRTRNAQVGLYQAGEVDYLVATDAIGMGLNMDVDHVAFAQLTKFDGRRTRTLTAAEVAQIAGRAGRHMNDGTFGTTADSLPLPLEVAEKVQNHDFRTVKQVYWRNTELDFRSIDALIAALEAPPVLDGLVKAPEATDETTLRALASDATIREIASSPDRVRLLWDVCRIPDFRKAFGEQHVLLLSRIFQHLCAGSSRGLGGRLPVDWVDGHLKRLDNADGDIQTLIDRIAGIRTWTYVSHRADWLPDPARWQERARAIEDRLSDALHERLTARFVDRRTAALVRKLKQMAGQEALMAAVRTDGEVVVEGEPIGRLEGFDFHPDRVVETEADRAVDSAARRALRTAVAERVKTFQAEADDAFALGADGLVTWRGAAVARLARGAEPMKPDVVVMGCDLVEGPEREVLRKRLLDWTQAHIKTVLAPLAEAREAELAGPARGLVFQLAEHLGTLPRAKAAEQIKPLTDEDRKQLARLGIRFGVETVFIPTLLKPAATHLAAQLWTAFQPDRDTVPAIPDPGRVSAPADPELPEEFYQAIGYRLIRGRIVRADMLERYAARARQLARDKVETLPGDMVSMLGLSNEEAAGMLKALGFHAEVTEEGNAVTFKRARRKPQPKPGEGKRPRKAGDRTGDRSGEKTGEKRGRGPKAGGGDKPARDKPAPAMVDDDHPFAKLRHLARPPG